MFTYIYYSECLLKIWGLGFVFGKDAYLKDNWNRLDFLIVFASLS